MKVDLKKLFRSDDITSTKFQNKLIEAIAKLSTEEFDYLKFKISVNKMIEMGMDSQTAIKSAYVTASVMGLSKAKLLRSANKYKNTLSTEREQFAAALKNNITKNIDGKKVEAIKLTKEIENHKVKIKKMLSEIELFEDKIASVDEVVQKNRNKIESTRTNFTATFDAIYSQIEEDILKIENSIDN
ncbi:MAG: hypothetical protein V3V14_10555 [Saprospiraceae bacterium]